jgi:hypothetical protein
MDGLFVVAGWQDMNINLWDIRSPSKRFAHTLTKGNNIDFLEFYRPSSKQNVIPLSSSNNDDKNNLISLTRDGYIGIHSI